MLDWNEYFIQMAKTAASRSNCIRRQVGAVIVDEHKKIKSSGYNGTPTRVLSCAERGECYRIIHNIPSGTRYETCQSIHAEQNAIIQAGEERCRNGFMYIYGHDFICILCKRFILQAKLKGVYLKKDDASEIIYLSSEDICKSLEEDFATA